jgi:hypothetical protein
MAFHIKDADTDRAVRELARLSGKSLTETVKDAVRKELEQARARVPLIERLRPIQDSFAALIRPGGKPADKAFFDELSGDA